MNTIIYFFVYFNVLVRAFLSLDSLVTKSDRGTRDLLRFIPETIL